MSHAVEQEAKQIGMDFAAQKHSEILDTFRLLARTLGRFTDVVTIDDVREEADSKGIKYTSSNWMGSVFSGNEWECVGFTVARHPKSHGRIIRQWRLK